MRRGTMRSNGLHVVEVRRSRLAFVCCCLIAISACVGAAAVLLLAKSGSKPLDPGVGAADRPLVTVPVRLAGVIDERARFRRIFCALDSDHGAGFPARRTCQEALQLLPGEDNPPSRPLSLGRPGGTPLLHIVIIPGMFGECVKHWALPLQDAAAYLRSQGYRVDTVEVGGRSRQKRENNPYAHTIHDRLRPGAGRGAAG